MDKGVFFLYGRIEFYKKPFIDEIRVVQRQGYLK